MTIDPKLIAQLLAEHGHRPEDIAGEEGLLKQLTKALLERPMDAELTDHLGSRDTGRLPGTDRLLPELPEYATIRTWTWEAKPYEHATPHELFALEALHTQCAAKVDSPAGSRSSDGPIASSERGNYEIEARR